MAAALALRGQVAGQINAIKPVTQILAETMAEFDQIVVALAARYGGAA